MWFNIRDKPLDAVLDILATRYNLTAQYRREHGNRIEYMCLNPMGEPHGSVLLALDGNDLECTHIDANGNWADGLPA